MAEYVTDRCAGMFTTFRESEKQSMPGVQEILGWLAFVNSQCPECSPLEWPISRLFAVSVPTLAGRKRLTQ